MPGALNKPGFWTFSLNLYPVLEDCLFFPGLDMFSMLTPHWYEAKNVDFETKFLFGMYQVLQGHLLWLEVHTITLSG